MTGTSSEWSEEAPGADILDLDRYMRGTRPARRRQTDLNTSGLVVDAGATGRSPSSSGSSASEPSDKRFSHDSGLSDTSYRRASRPARRNREPSVTNYDAETRQRGNKSGSEATRRRGKNSGSEATRRRGKNSGEARRGKSGGEARRGKTSGEVRPGKTSGEAKRGKSSSEARRGKSSGEARRGKSSSDSRRGKSSSDSRRGKSSCDSRRGKSGSEVERRTSDSRSSFRDSLERTLRDQQAQIARVMQMCELQARSSPSERHSERTSERRKRPSERPKRPSDRRSEKRSEQLESGRTSSYSTGFSSSSSSVDPLKRRNSECRTYKIIMSKLDELNRLFGTRRSAGAAAAPAARAAPPRPAACEDSSVTVSDKDVGTESPRHSARQKLAQSDHNRTIIVATAAVDIPPSPRLNVVTESVVRKDREISAPASEKGMPGQFHLDDPVRLYQQAKQLDAGQRRSDSSSSSRDSGRASGSGSGSSRGSRSGRPPSLCALCRCYWLVARRYVAQLSPVKE